MRLIELSDHPGGMLSAAKRQRHAAERRVHARYADAVTEHETRLGQARARRDRARTQHRWWAWIRGIFAVWTLRRRVPARPAPVSSPSGLEESIAAGMAGEQQIAAELGAALGDEWVLFRGYRNSRGEIDHLLLGPRGIFAIEVKYHNATVYISGDDWRFEKFDRWGNRVEQGRIADRTGRSPSVQLNQPADELARFLDSRGQPAPVTRIVVLNHPRSRVGSLQRPTVRVTTSSREILDVVRDSRSELKDTRLAQLARLVEQDHRFHNGRRPPPPR
jgi:Nuclease-related domain